MKIRINVQACCDPLHCRVCVDLCPEKVFATYIRRRREPDVEARDWIIFPMIASQCSGCMECVASCPRKAISVR